MSTSRAKMYVPGSSLRFSILGGLKVIRGIILGVGRSLGTRLALFGVGVYPDLVVADESHSEETTTALGNLNLWYQSYVCCTALMRPKPTEIVLSAGAYCSIHN